MRMRSLRLASPGRLAILAVVVAGFAIPTAASLGASSATPAAGVVTDYKAYLGARTGRAKGKPFVIGWINTQGGPLPSFIAATRAMIAGARYLNAELNGAHGNPISLHTCYIGGSEEEGKKCALEMANDPNVKVIVFGAVIVGNQSIYATIKGKKPIVIGVSASPVDGDQRNVYALNGDQPHVLGPWGTYGRDVLHAKTAAVINENLPGAIPAAQALTQGLQDAGIKVTHVQFDSTLTDLLGPVTAANVNKVDMIIPSVGFPYCVGIAKALQQTGTTKPVVALPLCTFIPAVAYPGGDFPKWVVGEAQVNTLINTPDVVKYLTTSAKYGLGKVDAQNVFASIAWAELLALVKIVNAIPAGKVSAATISAGLKTFKGPVVMGPPNIDCGQFAKEGARAICNNQTRFDEYLGNGQWKHVTGWLKPPK